MRIACGMGAGLMRLRRWSMGDWQRAMMWLAVVAYVATCALGDEIADWAVVLILTAAVSVALYVALAAIGVNV